MYKKDENTNNLRVIKTARNEDAINDAVDKGYRALVKPVVPSKDIKTKIAVFQNKHTGRVVVSGDYRYNFNNDENYKTIMDFTYYYPYSFESPFAAYLIPDDIEIGEKVFLEDLIEDIVGSCWNQGSAYRLDSCEAIWTGKEFDIQYVEKERLICVVG